MRSDKPNLIVDLSFEFALEAIEFCETLQKINKRVISNQLFKSCTSVGANIREAQNAESRSDFIHKMKIAAKEADEAEYWLELCDKSAFLPSNEKLLVMIRSIIKVLSKIIASSKNRK